MRFRVKHNPWLILIAISAIFFFSCKPENNLDNNLENDLVNTRIVDTFTIKSTTLLIDSVLTRTDKGGLVGIADMGEVGTVESQTFFAPYIPYDNLSFGTNAVCDSVKLFLRYPILSNESRAIYSSYARGDTTKPMDLSLYRLTENFDLDKQYSKNDVIPYNQTPIATLSGITHKPFKGTPISMNLPSSLGVEMISAASGTQTEFREAMKGFTLKQSSPDPSAVVAFNIFNEDISYSSYFRVFISNDTGSFFVNFRFNELYNNYKVDRSSSTLSALQNNGDVVEPGLTMNQSYIQGGTGIHTVLEIKGLRSFYEQNKPLSINKAFLELPVLSDDGSYYAGPPVRIVLFRGSDNNKIRYKGNTPMYITSSTSLSVSAQDAITFPYSGATNVYSMPIELWLENWLRNEEGDDIRIIIRSFRNTTSISSAAIATQQHPDAQPKLKLYFTKI
jgi:hypothetical protein